MNHSHDCIHLRGREVTNWLLQHCIEKAKNGYFLVYYAPVDNDRNLLLEFCLDKDCLQIYTKPDMGVKTQYEYGK